MSRPPSRFVYQAFMNFHEPALGPCISILFYRSPPPYIQYPVTVSYIYIRGKKWDDCMGVHSLPHGHVIYTFHRRTGTSPTVDPNAIPLPTLLVERIHWRSRDGCASRCPEFSKGEGEGGGNYELGCFRTRGNVWSGVPYG
jgi:hypothetical protein